MCAGMLKKTSSVDFSKYDQEEESMTSFNVGNTNSNIPSATASDEIQSVFYDWACEYFRFIYLSHFLM